MRKKQIGNILLFLCLIIVLLVTLLILLPEKRNQKKDIILKDKYVEPIATPENTGKPRKSKQKEERFLGKLAIVFDDVGYNLKEIEPFLQFPHALSFAILPQLPYSMQAAKLIKQAGKEILLHQPMEAVGKNETGPGTIYTNLSYPEIEEILRINLSTVPGAIGINNHMGSKITANEEVMSMIMYFLYMEGLFFLDSKTTANSICTSVAKKMGIQFARRDIFLDIHLDKDIIRKQIIKGIDIAYKNGSAILIGHIQNNMVLDVLYDMLPIIRNKKLKIVGVSDIIEE